MGARCKLPGKKGATRERIQKLAKVCERRGHASWQDGSWAGMLLGSAKRTLMGAGLCWGAEGVKGLRCGGNEASGPEAIRYLCYPSCL